MSPSVLPALLVFSIMALIASAAWLATALRRMPARFATAFDHLPPRPQPMPLPRPVCHAARALAAAMLMNSALALAMAG